MPCVMTAAMNPPMVKVVYKHPALSLDSMKVDDHILVALESDRTTRYFVESSGVRTGGRGVGVKPLPIDDWKKLKSLFSDRLAFFHKKIVFF